MFNNRGFVTICVTSFICIGISSAVTMQEFWKHRFDKICFERFKPHWKYICQQIGTRVYPDHLCPDTNDIEGSCQELHVVFEIMNPEKPLGAAKCNALLCHLGPNFWKCVTASETEGKYWYYDFDPQKKARCEPIDTINIEIDFGDDGDSSNAAAGDVSNTSAAADTSAATDTSAAAADTSAATDTSAAAADTSAATDTSAAAADTSAATDTSAGADTSPGADPSASYWDTMLFNTRNWLNED